MTSILIMSDSHRLTREIDNIKQRHDVTACIHCGDSELPTDHPVLDSIHVVRGNCDWYGRFPKEQTTDIAGNRLFFTHGHLYNVKKSLLNLQYRAKEEGATIACFGHSHVAYADVIKGILFINPGSIQSPRHFSIASYAIIEWTEPTHVTVDFYDLTGKRIETFPYSNEFLLK